MHMGTVAGYQTTTIRLPRDLYEQARTAVKEAGVASSLNDFLIAALQGKLRELREEEIDRAFAEMSSDERYQEEAVALARSFANSDWEAYQAGNAVGRKNAAIRKKNPSKTSTR